VDELVNFPHEAQLSTAGHKIAITIRPINQSTNQPINQAKPGQAKPSHAKQGSK